MESNMLQKLRQFINRLKFAPRAIKQTLLNLKETTSHVLSVVFLLGIVSPVVTAGVVIGAVLIYLRYNTKPSMYDVKYQRLLDRAGDIYTFFDDKFEADV